jgi:serine/threonine-protein kinase
LVPPSEINPNLSSHVEKAILWAMSLHPDNRPLNVLALRDALIGKQEVPLFSIGNGLSFDTPQITIFSSEQIAGYVAAGLFVIGLVATLIR